MRVATCKQCGSSFNPCSGNPGLFCSVKCRGEWKKTQNPIDRAWLYQKYIVERLEIHQIAKLLNRDSRMVKAWIDRHGIPIHPREIECLPNEEWRDLPDYDGIYKVSSLGRVMLAKKRRFGKAPGTILKQSKSSPGKYLCVPLSKDRKEVKRYVHQLVARTFLGECPQGMVVNHIDFNRQNNSVANLEYLTRLENIRYSARAGRMRGVGGLGRRGPRSLTDEQVRAIREELANGASLSEIGRKYQRDSRTIHSIHVRETYKEL